MRVGISGAHGTGKTTLAEALCARLPGHVAADEPYYLLEEQGYEFGLPPSPVDYRGAQAGLRAGYMAYWVGVVV
jgi:AAA domain